MRHAVKAFLLVTFIALFFGGCATSRGIVSIQLPEANIAKQSNGQTIFIRSVTDARVFEQKPDSPDIPSLGFGGADTASNDLKKRAVARKRNGYGKALGDILLEENQTVESVVKDSLIRSFSEAGYEVITNKDNLKTNTVIVDTSIEKFWSWMNLGFWSITLNSEIGTKITIANDPGKPKNVFVKSEGHYQVASEKNWMAIMNKSLEQFNDKVKEQFSSKE
jgi:hypothetical protein